MSLDFIARLASEGPSDARCLQRPASTRYIAAAVVWAIPAPTGERGRMMSDLTYEGGCLCGNVRYRASGEATNLAYCHCRSCRGSSGAPFVAWATFAGDRFEIVKGSPVTNRSSKHVERRFCGQCGAALTYVHAMRPEQIDVTLATMDDTRDLRPEAHIWVSQKLAWVTLEDHLPQHSGWPKV
jgi:hypothetical protein